MRKHRLQGFVTTLVLLASVAVQRPVAASRCDDPTAALHPCCCKVAVPAEEATSKPSCCSTETPPAAPTVPADDCGCRIGTPAAPYDAPRVATTLPTAVAVLVVSSLPAPLPSGTFSPAPVRASVHAPPERDPSAPRGPPLHFSNSVA